MVYYTILSEDENDDMLFYADDAIAEGNEVAANLSTNKTLDLSVIVVESDSDEKSSNLTSEIQVIASPSIIYSDGSITIGRGNKKSYRCSKCGALKKGHICPVISYSSSEDSSVITDPPNEVSRMASNRVNLTRLAQRVEGDNSSDPDWVAPRSIDTSSIRTSPRLLAQKRTISTIVPEIDEDVPARKTRKLYECRICHVPLKGHKCPHKYKLTIRQRRQLSETTTVILDRVNHL